MEWPAPHGLCPRRLAQLAKLTLSAASAFLFFWPNEPWLTSSLTRIPAVCDNGHSSNI
jgi:hypothetical protein